MKKILLAVGLFFSGFVLAGGDIAAGKVKSQSCAACHGVDGNPLQDIYPKLAGQHELYLIKQLKEFKLGMETAGKSGRYDPVMSPMAAPLSGQDILDLAAFYQSQTMSPNTTPESAIEEGGILYRAGDLDKGLTACIACHGPRGDGGNLSGFPKISGQNAPYLQSQLEKFHSGARVNDLNGMMRSISAKLTSEEMGVLADYLGGLH